MLLKRNLLRLLWSTTLVLGSWANSVSADAVQTLQQQLQQAHGKVVYLDFWASWCKPCRYSFPWMNEMKAKYESEGLVVITVNLDKDAELARQFLQENPADFAILYDPEGATAKKYKLKGMPMSFVFNRSGQPVSGHVGFNDSKKAEYEAELVKWLAVKNTD